MTVFAAMGKQAAGSSVVVLIIMILILPAVLSCGSEERSQKVASRYNVLLISIDAARRDLFSAYGFRPRYAPDLATSPNIDRLAEEGVLLEDAYATTSWTLPSHLSMFTGQPELIHAVELDHLKPDGRHAPMAEVLKGHGYRTMGFYSGPYMGPHWGFDRGFDRYEACFGEVLTEAWERNLAAANRLAVVRDSSRATQAEFQAALEERMKTAQATEAAAQRDVSSDTVTEAVLKALEAASNESSPFFIFAHYFDPHFDYNPPTPYKEMFDPLYDGHIDGSNFIRSETISVTDRSRFGNRVKVLSDRDLEHIYALYAGELAWTDAQIGRVLHKLEGLGLHKKTLVIVTTDHGGEFFEHGSLGHRLTLFEEAVQVPMILRLPDVLPAGKRVSGLVSLIDLLPTVLDLLELPPVRGLTSKSFLPLVQGYEDGSDRSVLGRVVKTFDNALLQAPTPESDRGKIPGKYILIRETYRKGSIKIHRERSWTKPLAKVSPRTRVALAAQSRAMFQQEKLSWVDVERFPKERPEDYSTDFSDPKIQAVLREFHDKYSELLTRRKRVRVQDRNQEFGEVLTALGYVDRDPRVRMLNSDEIILPPPGHEILMRRP
jgi:arylsulfatase A-like enzyme